VGVGYFAERPSPDDLPRKRRQIQGSANVKNQMAEINLFLSQGVGVAGGNGIRQLGSN
jgi:hypothetical protein